MWMADNNLGFPVNSEQINNHWSENVCTIKGHLKKRKTDRSQFSSVRPSKSPIEADVFSKVTGFDSENENIPVLNVEERNVQIGLEVGSDIIGPILGAFIAIFIDKACGIGFLRALD